MLFVYLSASRNVLILEQAHFRFIEVNFPCKGEGNRKKLSFPSTVDNFLSTFRPPGYSFIAPKAKNFLLLRLFLSDVMMAWRSYTPCNCTYLHIFNERGMSHSFDSNWPTSKQEEKFVGACLKPKLENYESEDNRLQYFWIKKLAKIPFHSRTLRSHLYGLGHPKQLYPRVCVVVLSFSLFLCNVNQPFTLGSRARLGGRENSLSELSHLGR